MKTLQRSLLHLGVLLLALTIWTGCDSGPDDATPTGSLSGVVREAGTNDPIPGVTVKAGNVETTTGADGRFALSDVPAGPSVLVEASIPGFDFYLQRIAVQAGENTHDIALMRKNYYEYSSERGNLGLFLPPNVPMYRAVLFYIAPRRVDARGFANGKEILATAAPTPEAASRLKAQAAGLRERALQQLAEKHGLALMGSDLFLISGQSSNSSQISADVLAALDIAAERSGHPELAQVPLMLVGMSNGGCSGYTFTRQHSRRVIGFMTQKGACHNQGDAGEARLVPGYFFLGETDVSDPPENITNAFLANRKGDALWALAVEPDAGHVAVDALDLFVDWIDTVLETRLPETGTGGALRAIDEASGWLGDRESFVIAPYACYEGDRLTASWLPTEQTARDWQAFVSDGTVTDVTACGAAGERGAM